ncbi:MULTISPECIES: 3-phosphoshikimate 1-carboxyvinyltransferase [Salegentibacter]|uniref:3-phosphoshikimate 1-carboxyvinyltransferase n=1 Tax=Salegentibacter maritimus TaxID=2794347 RepID=A0ABS0TER9_9FLAO|nr:MULTISPECIES: 3-phosphoshikimate 1-carboxyvinyltransferase [Salegentibacter]MBE7640957.1 3-phosphoshikimate 1-carboxyvinyltransferase [Salegentibacter sp. BLCTC]MBI6116039.1 3-phosphoshikimate 1-carboxyvinyltransferase [Salegentibacter maritimus]MBI6119513.1 3-phosphoshikimate 1-carboxyvinyltransferase [Salegentibacter maritimus]
MNLEISNSQENLSANINITGSKSESNRLLILQALFPNLKISNLSNSDDTHYLQKALKSEGELIDIHHAGTAMRFLTAYFATLEGREVVLTGSKRMKERPVKLLVDALKTMGADISYEKNEGYPPIRIKGKKITAKTVSLEANISSQYISALMLVAPSLPNGLEINLQGEITSTPYIKMTLELLQRAGVRGVFEGNTIKIEPAKQLKDQSLAVESDWSSASYYYSLAAISESAELKLSTYRETSLQGDSCLSNIYKQFGVSTKFEDNHIILSKKPGTKPKHIKENLQNSPDIAQTIAVTCLALEVPCYLTGLHTLKIKETDRLEALKAEIEKFGSQVEITQDSLELFPKKDFEENVSVATYNDHRMAMAFAPLGLKVPFKIEDAEVVSKSYPGFWEDFEKLNFKLRKC